jgi:hypothetical protein
MHWSLQPHNCGLFESYYDWSTSLPVHHFNQLHYLVNNFFAIKAVLMHSTERWSLDQSPIIA